MYIYRQLHLFAYHRSLLSNTFIIELLLLVSLFYCADVLWLFPWTGKHFIESLLEYTTVHINKSFLLVGIGVSDYRDKTKVP